MTASKAQAQLTPEQHLANLRGIIEGSRTVMLMTHGPSGRIDGRPMALVRTGPDDAMYLTTSIESNKLAEIAAYPHVSITANHDGIAIVEGIARVSQERTLIDELWRESWSAWYPDGKTDPTIAIIIVQPTEGTYWDMSMTAGLSYFFRQIKARITGHEIEVETSDAAHLELGRAAGDGKAAGNGGGNGATSRRAR